MYGAVEIVMLPQPVWCSRSSSGATACHQRIALAQPETASTCQP